MIKKNYLVIIPARIGSKRLPGKPLIKLKGVSIIQRTHSKCAKAVTKDYVYVATDSKKIYDHCKQNRMNCIMTSKKCLTGSDRIAEAAKKINSKYYVNIQGDEPFFAVKDILTLIKYSKKFPKMIIAGYANIKHSHQYFSKNVPKVVLNNKNELMYMSRAPIPGNKENKFYNAYRQVCGYVLPKKKLSLFYNRKKKSRFENIEDIEILHFLEMGEKVKMVKLSDSSISIDTKSDIVLAKKKLKIK